MATTNSTIKLILRHFCAGPIASTSFRRIGFTPAEAGLRLAPAENGSCDGTQNGPERSRRRAGAESRRAQRGGGRSREAIQDRILPMAGRQNFKSSKHAPKIVKLTVLRIDVSKPHQHGNRERERQNGDRSKGNGEEQLIAFHAYETGTDWGGSFARHAQPRASGTNCCDVKLSGQTLGSSDTG
jgi:hypothetical protein